MRARTLTRSAHDVRNAAGLSTCSRTSIEHTRSNRFGSCTRVSAGAWRYVSEPHAVADAERGESEGSAAACSDAMAMLDSDASMAVVCAPSLVRAY